MNQISERKKSAIKESNGNTTDFYRPGYKLQVSKKLNPLAYMIIGSIYTLAVIMTTLFFTQDAQKKSKKYFSHSDQTPLKEEIIREITKLQKTKNPNIDTKIERQMELLRNDLISEVNKMNLKYIDMIEQKSIYKDNIIEEISNREPASEKIKKGKALVYNKVNERVLRYKHKKHYDRMQEKFKAQKHKLMATLDLSNENDRQKLKNFEDEKDLVLYELKTRQRYIRRQFEKQKYIVLNK